MLLIVGQFNALVSKDPHLHFKLFLDVKDAFKIAGALQVQDCWSIAGSIDANMLPIFSKRSSKNLVELFTT